MLAVVDCPTDSVRMRLWITRCTVNVEVTSTSGVKWTEQLGPDMRVSTGLHDSPPVLLRVLNSLANVLVWVSGHLRNTRYE